MKDGIYFDVVAIKDGVEYSVKRISASDVSKELVNSLMNGLGTVLGISEEDIKECEENK